MRDQIKPVAVAAEPFGVAIDKADRAADLPDHRTQIAAGIVDIDEIEHREIGAGAHERLGEERELGCRAVRQAPPYTKMATGP